MAADADGAAVTRRKSPTNLQRVPVSGSALGNATTVQPPSKENVLPGDRREIGDGFSASRRAARKETTTAG